MPITAVHILNNDVQPFFEQHDASISTILSDNGREFRSRADSHPYELFLQLEEIEHRTTRVRRPQSSELVERMHRGYALPHQEPGKWHESLEEMQLDLDET